MTAPSPKQLALQAVEQLSDDASLEDAMERLYVLESIERGRADIAAGRVVTHDEACGAVNWRADRARGDARRLPSHVRNTRA